MIVGVLAPAAVGAVIVAAAVALGGPAEPAPLASMNNPFRGLDLSRMPALSTVAARDGTPLGYRHYRAASPRGSVVLVHGSSASSNSLHVLAQALLEAGYDGYALDMRGHGATGTRGQVGYIGQLEDDLEDFMRAVRPRTPVTLLGFSSGGGFALRVAGSERQDLFDGYLLLAPFISQDAPTYRPGSGGWVEVGVPRIVGLSVLNAMGVHAFDHLVVTRFALAPEARPLLTPAYSFALAQNFRPQADYAANIRAVRRPLAVVAGAADEAFHADRYEAVFRDAGRSVPVRIVPGVGHIPLTLEPGAVRAVVEELERLGAAGS